MKDWKGNSKSTCSTLGATSHSENEREKDDYYATSPIAVHELMKVEKLKAKSAGKTYKNEKWEAKVANLNYKNLKNQKKIVNQ